MLHISLDPAIFAKEPWASIVPENQRDTFVYVLDHSASVSTEAQIWPKPTGDGMINGSQYVTGQSTSRSLAIGINGEQFDEQTMITVFGTNGSGGMLQFQLARAVQAGILRVAKENGTYLTANQILTGAVS
jgi:hypothetical protein